LHIDIESVPASNEMAIELLPLPLPASADASKFKDFGREVKGVNPGELTPEEFEEVKKALYTVSAISRCISPDREANVLCSIVHSCSEMSS
jgi:hypothetical protein